ncbi:GNAT family N-acetyltransferase [Streptomyces sp. NPDC050164]|uniref:GNAT family N-acetyltransferase n=1 Tax=Streptomyces sp. NPDC050164 TaxID=3365605 RepID=UPI003790C08E
MPLIRSASRSDHPMVLQLLEAEDLGPNGSYSADGVDVIVADRHGQVVGVAEYSLNCDFGRPQGRPDHPGEQAWIYSITVAHEQRRNGLGRALLAEVARRAQAAGRTVLAMTPQEGSDVPSRLAFFRACGLALIESNTPGAAWGCTVSGILAAL